MRLLSELRLAARTLRASPAFAAVSIAALALGLGANAMLFSVADAVLLRPFPFAHADRLVIAGENLLEPRSEITYRDFLAWRSGAGAFDDLAAIGSSNWSWRLRTLDQQVEVRYRAVSGHFFDLVGARALFGRALRADDDRAEAARVVVLSHGFWRRQLGGDSAVVGRSIVLGGTSFAIVGVMPAEFRYPAAPDMWTPIVPEFASIAAGVPGAPADLGDAGVLYTIGRLKPQATVTAARLDLNRVIQARTRQTSRRRAVQSHVTTVTDEILGSNRVRVLSLSLAAGVLLLIACANIAGLMLVRASSRGREFAVRLALGASPAALARQLFFEALWLSLGATIAAIVAADALLPLVVAMLPADVPRIGEAALNGRAIAFACGIGILTAVLSAIAPAITTARVELEPLLRKGGHTVGAGLRHPFRRALIVAELAAAVVLITAVGLLTRSVVQLRHLDIGFNPRGLVAIEMSMPAERMQEADARALLASAADALARLPGVASVSSVSLRPLQGPVGLDSPYEAEGQTPEQARKNPYVNTQTISPSYFNTMQTPLVAGRAFDDGDRAETARVLIVSRRFAELAWPGQNALGKRLRVAALDRTEPPTRAWWTVIGVVSDIRYRALASPGITLYAPITQSPDRASELVLRTSAPVAMVTGPIRGRLHAMNANGIVTIALMEQLLRTLEAPWRANLALFGVFAGLSVLLAAIGLYGMLAYAVATERRAIGVRLVLGATPGRIARDVVMDGARIIAAGTVGGAAAALVVLRLMAAILFEVSPADPLTLVAAPIVFAVVALIACAVPAVRAARTEPAICLRAE